MNLRADHHKTESICSHKLHIKAGVKGGTRKEKTYLIKKKKRFSANASFSVLKKMNVTQRKSKPAIFHA